MAVRVVVWASMAFFKPPAVIRGPPMRCAQYYP
jgi:hypothetical protein